MKQLYIPPIVIVLFATVAAPAQAFMPTAIFPQPSAPVTIDACAAGIRTSGAATNGLTTYYIDFGANFTNHSPLTASAVRLRFDLFDAKGEHLKTFFGSDGSQAMATGVQRIDLQPNSGTEQAMRQSGASLDGPLYVPAWDWLDTASTAKTAICSVDAVRFSNGYHWQATSPSKSDFAAALQTATAVSGTFYKYE